MFIVRDGVIYTPPLSASILGGITRDSVITLARELGYHASRETNLPREVLYIADEVFFVGTAAEVTPIRSIDKITIGAGRRGPITEALQQAFFDVINGEVPDTHGWLTYVYPEEAALRTSRRSGAASERSARLGLRAEPLELEACSLSLHMHVNDLLKIAVDSGASDLHLKVGSYPMMRVRGTLVPVVEDKRLDHDDVVAMSAAIMSTSQRQKFKEAQEVDLAYSVAGLGRFRCNVFQQRGTVGLVLRVIPMQIRTIDELGLPPVLKTDRRGRARPRARHRHDRQRQEHDARGDDRPHQPHALRARHDGRGSDRVPAPRPPVDRQPARGRRSTRGRSRRRCAARCGRIPTSSSSAKCATSRRSRPASSPPKPATSCFSTLHTLDATETINRIIAVFPPHQQKQVRLQLASVLKAVISQRLHPARRRQGPRAGGRSDDHHRRSSATASSTRTRPT